MFRNFLNLFFVSNFGRNHHSSKRYTIIVFIICLLLILISGLIIGMVADTANKRARYFMDGHALYSLNLAINEALCHKESMLSSYSESIMKSMGTGFDHDATVMWLDKPILTIPQEILGISKEKYCKSVHFDFLKNENTLMRLESYVMQVFSKISVHQMIQLFEFIRILGIISVFGFLVCIGFSPFLGICSGMLAIFVTYRVSAVFPLSLYPFVPTFFLLYSSLITLIIHQRWYKNYGGNILSCILLGFFGALFFNLRTDWLPFVAIGFTIFLVAIYIDNIQQKSTNKLVTFIIALFVFSVSFYYAHSKINVFKTPEQISSGSGKLYYSYHVIAHPLTLALASDRESDLTKREGIKWEDSIGETLAKKVNPNSTILGPTYEKDLFTYYWGLWKKYPGEMSRIYLDKWFSVFNESAASKGPKGLIAYICSVEFLKSIDLPIKIVSAILVALVTIVFFVSLIKRNLLYAAHFLIGFVFFQYVILGRLYFGGVIYSSLLLGVVVVAISKIRQCNVAITAFILSLAIGALLIMMEAAIIKFGVMYHVTFFMIIGMFFLYYIEMLLQKVFSIMSADIGLRKLKSLMG